jgi:hypothetical protein
MGGVAIYARTRLDATLVHEAPKLGMAWIRTYGTHIGVCYIPHANSSYYKHGGDNISIEDHFLTLCKIIGIFQEKGNVVLMGDFNARVGLGVGSDVTEIGDEPVSQPNSTDSNQSIPPSCSTDTAPPNRLGGALLQLCAVTGLIILNGRTEGDL